MDVLADPVESVEVAQAPLAFLDIGLDEVAAVAQPFVALVALGLKPSAHRFGHGAEHALPGGLMLIDSYHCSRYNTNTGVLTPQMFRAVFADVRRHLGRR